MKHNAQFFWKEYFSEKKMYILAQFLQEVLK